MMMLNNFKPEKSSELFLFEIRNTIFFNESLNNLQRVLELKSYHMIEWLIKINKFRTRKPYTELHEPKDEFYQRDDFAECMLLGNSCVC